MTELTKEVLEVFLKHLTDRAALTIFLASLVCFILMLFPGPLGSQTRMHWFFITTCFVLSVCYLPTRFVLENASEYETSRKRNRRLDDLVPEEKAILKEYMSANVRTRWISTKDAVAKGLADDGVLYKPAVPPDATTGWSAFNIQEWARLRLKKHPEKLQ